MTRVGNRPQPGQAVYIGVDVARTKWAIVVRWGGQEQRRCSTPGDLRQLQALVTEYAACAVHVAYEACGFGYEIAWWVEAHGGTVVVVAPSTVARVPGSRVKTDRLDAAALARQLEQGQLKGVAIPTRGRHEHRQLSRTYAQVLHARQRAQVQLRSLLQEQGRIGPAPRAGWRPYATWLAQQTLPAPVTPCVSELLAVRAAAATSAQHLKAAVLALATSPEYAPIVTALRPQRGIGPFTAIRLVLELGDITRFGRAGSFTHYVGLTPSEYSSGERVHRGHLLKCGPGFLRAWLLECAWRSITATQPDPALRACYLRLAPRVGNKRAIVAVARRLALRVRARWLAAVRPLAHAA